jgi:hypothetical protein
LVVAFGGIDHLLRSLIQPTRCVVVIPDGVTQRVDGRALSSPMALLGLTGSPLPGVASTSATRPSLTGRPEPRRQR